MTPKEYSATRYVTWAKDPIGPYLSELTVDEKLEFFKEYLTLPYPRPPVENGILIEILQDLIKTSKS